VWVGTNDGNLQVSRDGGSTWKNVVDRVPGVPKETHVSRVEPSHFDAGTCYVTFDGHRTDDMKPYVFVTRDFGETWTSIAGNLADGNVNVITEDPRNPNLLFLGTEYALYVSLDGGKEWKRFMNGLPTVRIDDIIVHPRDHDLIAGTHGRSIWIVDDITPLEQLTDDVTKGDGYLFDVRPGTAWITDIQKQLQIGGAKNFRGQNPAPGTAVAYWLKNPASNVKISITDITGREVRSMDGAKSAGLNRVQWDLRTNPPQRGTPPATGQGAEAAAAGAPATPPPNPPAAGRQGQGREDQPPATPPAGRGAREGQPPTAAPPQSEGEGAPQGGGPGGGGRGRGAFAPALPAGSYLLKVTVDGKVIGTKTVVIQPDALQ
jgi:hypothetical protein